MMRLMQAICTALLLLAAPVHAAGQSLFNSAGLGRPLEAVDARARALGSFGIGLQGGAIAPTTDPAAAARLPFPSGVMVGQPSWVEASRASVDAGDFRGTRFPLLGIAYPLLGGMATVHLGSVLDQRFQGERPVTIELDGASHEVMDLFTQEGGVSTAGLGYAHMVGDRLSVGVTVGRYTGSVIRELTRNFGDLDLDGTESFTTSGFWTYSGTMVTAGATADVGSIGRLAASATWSSGLDADASSSTTGADRSYDLPVELRVGGSAVLSPGLVLVASAVRADWSTLQDDLSGGVTAHATTGFGIGVELAQVRLLARRAPIRLGYRRSGLPFSLTDESATESAFTGGLGFLFNEANGVVLAGVDLSVERGERNAGSIVEQFWRGTVALRVSGL